MKRSTALVSVMQMINITLNDMARNYDDDRDGKSDVDMSAEEIHDRKGYTSIGSRIESQLLRLRRIGFGFCVGNLVDRSQACWTGGRRMLRLWTIEEIRIDRIVCPAQIGL